MNTENTQPKLTAGSWTSSILSYLRTFWSLNSWCLPAMCFWVEDMTLFLHGRSETFPPLDNDIDFSNEFKSLDTWGSVFVWYVFFFSVQTPNLRWWSWMLREWDIQWGGPAPNIVKVDSQSGLIKVPSLKEILFTHCEPGFWQPVSYILNNCSTIEQIWKKFSWKSSIKASQFWVP